MRALTISELKQYDGRGGRPAYVAYRGKVYDVSQSFLWKGGTHQALHDAGRDLTAEINDAPHGDEFITRFPVVGELIEGPNES